MLHPNHRVIFKRNNNLVDVSIPEYGYSRLEKSRYTPLMWQYDVWSDWEVVGLTAVYAVSRCGEDNGFDDIALDVKRKLLRAIKEPSIFPYMRKNTLASISYHNSSIIEGSGFMNCQSCIYYNAPIHGNEIHCALHPDFAMSLAIECLDREAKR